MGTLVGVAVESEDRIVEVVLTTEENFDKTAAFMFSRWHGAKELKIRRCIVSLGEYWVRKENHA